MAVSLPLRRLAALAVLAAGGYLLRCFGAAEKIPPLAIAYGYWALWAGALYFLVALLMPARPGRQILTIAALVCALVEVSKVSRLTALDIFRLTPVGDWLLGRAFSIWHFFSFALGLGLALGLDALLNRRRRKKSRARRR